MVRLEVLDEALEERDVAERDVAERPLLMTCSACLSKDSSLASIVWTSW